MAVVLDISIFGAHRQTLQQQQLNCENNFFCTHEKKMVSLLHAKKSAYLLRMPHAQKWITYFLK